MGIPAVEALRGALPVLFGSPLKQIVPERGGDSPWAISNEKVDVYIKPQTEAIASMTIATFGGDNNRHYGLVLSEGTEVTVNPSAGKPQSVTIKDTYNRQSVTIFEDGVTSQRFDVRV